MIMLQLQTIFTSAAKTWTFSSSNNYGPRNIQTLECHTQYDHLNTTITTFTKKQCHHRCVIHSYSNHTC